MVDSYLQEAKMRKWISPASDKTYRNALMLFVSLKYPLDVGCLLFYDEYLAKEKYPRGGKWYPYSSSTRAVYIHILKSFLHWMTDHDLLSYEVRAKAITKYHVFHIRSKGRAIKSRTPSPQLEQLICYYDDIALPDSEQQRLILLRNRALIHCLWDTAARISEVLSIQQSEANGGKIEYILITGKGAKERKIHFSQESRAAISAYLKARHDDFTPLFISHGRDIGHQMTSSRAWQVVKDAGAALDLKGMVSPHMFRHARASQLLNEGMPLEQIQTLLGHSSIETTQRFYAKFRDDRLHESFLEYSPPSAELIRRLKQKESDGKL